MADKPLTQQDFARMGAQATNTKYPKEVRSAWGKKGAQALKDKYGEDYFKKMAQKREENKKKKEEEGKPKGFLKGLLGIK